LGRSLLLRQLRRLLRWPLLRRRLSGGPTCLCPACPPRLSFLHLAACACAYVLRLALAQGSLLRPMNAREI
jgi:hypothetical protein